MIKRFSRGMHSRRHISTRMTSACVTLSVKPQGRREVVLKNSHILRSRSRKDFLPGGQDDGPGFQGGTPASGAMSSDTRFYGIESAKRYILNHLSYRDETMSIMISMNDADRSEAAGGEACGTPANPDAGGCRRRVQPCRGYYLW
jgi:hypothetical protein